MRTEQDWIDRFTELGALWIHDENPKRPHALLTSGNHSNGFFNASKVIELPRVLEEACTKLIHTMEPSSFAAIDIVIGSALGAVSMAHEIGRQLSIRAGFTEPIVIDEMKRMVLKRFDVESETHILVVEDVVTTGGTTRKTISVLQEQGAYIFPIILVLVNRSGKSHLDGRDIHPLIHHPMPMWSPDECPLCEKGSEAVRPKGNWDLLIKPY